MKNLLIKILLILAVVMVLVWVLLFANPASPDDDIDTPPPVTDDDKDPDDTDEPDQPDDTDYDPEDPALYDIPAITTTVEVLHDDSTVLVSGTFKTPDFTGVFDENALPNVSEYYQNVISDAELEYDYLEMSAIDSYEQSLVGGADALLPYTLDGDYVIALNSPTHVSVLRESRTYAGGLVANTAYMSETFRKTDGAYLILDDVFSVGYDEYSEVIFKAVDELIKSSPESFYEDAQSFAREAFNPQNFYLVEGGMIVYFNSYDIAPGSEGPQTVGIAFDDIKDILNEEFK